MHKIVNKKITFTRSTLHIFTYGEKKLRPKQRKHCEN